MNDAGIWQTDVFVYIVPGYVLLLSVVYAHRPRYLRVTKEKLGAGEVLASAVAALLFGLVIHQISTLGLAVIQHLFLWPTFDGIARDFGHEQLVCVKIGHKLGVPTFDPGDCYLYARTLVAKETPHVAESNERLLRLANVCQNMVTAVCVASVVMLRARQARRIKPWCRVALGVVALTIMAAFGYGMVKYWTAAIFRTLRAALLLL